MNRIFAAVTIIALAACSEKSEVATSEVATSEVMPLTTAERAEFEKWLLATERDLLVEENVSRNFGYRAASVDLDQDGESELVVRYESPAFCGSGGCTMIVLKRAQNKLEKVSRSTVTQLPIGLAVERSNGWSNLIVGIRNDYAGSRQARLRYDGTSYPLNPTVPPSEPTEDLGEVLINDATPLFTIK